MFFHFRIVEPKSISHFNRFVNAKNLEALVIGHLSIVNGHSSLVKQKVAKKKTNHEKLKRVKALKREKNNHESAKERNFEKEASQKREELSIVTS